MDDAWLMAIVYSGVLLFVLVLVVVMVLFFGHINKRRAVSNTVRTTAKIVSKRTKWSRYASQIDDFRTYYTLAYSYGGADYAKETLEMPVEASVGDCVPILLDPRNPEHFYVEGAVESMNKGRKRALIVIMCILAYFLLLPIVVFLLS